MNDSRKRGGLIVSVAMGALVLVGVYVLSVGPMCWLAKQGYVAHDSKFLAAFYWPLFVVAQNFGPLKWYIKLFIR